MWKKHLKDWKLSLKEIRKSCGEKLDSALSLCGISACEIKSEECLAELVALHRRVIRTILRLEAAEAAIRQTISTHFAGSATAKLIGSDSEHSTENTH